MLVCVLWARSSIRTFLSPSFIHGPRGYRKNCIRKKNKELETCFLVSKRFAYDGDDDDPNPVHVGTSEPTEDDDLRETG